MVRGFVRVYIEGGAEGGKANSDFRRSWKHFLIELHKLAMRKGYQGLQPVRGMGRGRAFHSFSRHPVQYPDDLGVLLVDAETAVPKNTRVWDVVARRVGDQWRCPPWAKEDHLYLMVHSVETWLLTDPDALQKFFGRDFNRRPLPTTNLESWPKDEIETALRKATKDSAKGAYRHGHANQIIGMVDPTKVKKLRHGGRLFNSLASLIERSA